jgi:hypothetical protein
METVVIARLSATELPDCHDWARPGAALLGCSEEPVTVLIYKSIKLIQ